MLVEAGLPRGWGLSSYDPKSQQVKNLGICGRPYYFHVDNYVENLVLLNKPNDAVFEREWAGRGNAGISLIQLKISAFTFLSLILFLIYSRHCLCGYNL